MTVIALLSVAPVTEGSMAGEVAKAVDALDDFEVSYETNPMGTVVEAESIEELMAAAMAAHEAVDGDRVSTVLKIDDKRTGDRGADEKVDAVEEALGRPARSSGERSGEREGAADASPSAPAPDPDSDSDPDSTPNSDA